MHSDNWSKESYTYLMMTTRNYDRKSMQCCLPSMFRPATSYRRKHSVVL